MEQQEKKRPTRVQPKKHDVTPFMEPDAIVPIGNKKPIVQLPFEANTNMAVEAITNTTDWLNDMTEIMGHMSEYTKDCWARGDYQEAMKSTKLMMEFQKQSTSNLAARDSLIATLTARGYMQAQETRNLDKILSELKDNK